MFECAETMLVQLIEIMPYVIGVYLLFDFTGSLLFGKR